MRSIVVSAFVLLIGNSAHASNSGLDGLFIAAAIGGGVNTTVQGALGRLPEELQDWRDPRSQSTARLDEQCGVLTEMKIVQTGRLNFMFLGIRNEGQEDLQVRLDRVLAKFGSGKERYFLSPPGSRVQEIKRGWYSWGLLAFPRKIDFKDQEQLDVIVPLVVGANTSCELKARFNRDQNLPADRSSYLEAPTLVVSMGAGSIAERLGGLKDATSGGGGGLEIYMAGFSKPQSGWFWQISTYNLGSVEKPQMFENNNYKRVQGYDMAIGKAWRFFHADRFASYYNVGPSIASYSAVREGNNDSNTDTRDGFGAYASYTLEWRYAREYFGVFRGDYSLGITAFAKYYPLTFKENPKDAGTIGIVFEFLRGGE